MTLTSLCYPLPSIHQSTSGSRAECGASSVIRRPDVGVVHANYRWDGMGVRRAFKLGVGRPGVVIHVRAQERETRAQRCLVCL
jgi:hypothetical protein